VTKGPPPHADAPTAERVPTASTAEGRAAVAFVSALGKAARAFTLYDAGNTVVRQFIADYRARAEEVTAGGPLMLDVRPFELLREGEVVYREDDRERSLAFRLFRDGVRRIAFQKGVPFGELLVLLQILAIRFTGIRQAEEDVVTLLRKAEFGRIHITAVEGYVPDEELPEAIEPFGREDPGARPPAGFDRPFPRLPAPGPLAFRDVPDASLAALRAEEVEAALPASAFRLAQELLGLGGQGALEPGEVASYLAEFRNFLVADGQLGPLSALAELAAAQPPGRLRDAVLRGLADARLVDVVLASIPAGSRTLPPEAARLLPFVPASAVLDRLADEPSEEARDVLVRLASARLPADADAVVARLPALAVDAARVLWRAVAARAPAHSEAAALALLDHPDTDLRVEALGVVTQGEGRVPTAPLLRLLGAPSEAERVAAAEALARHGDAAAARVVAAALTDRKTYSFAEAEALGRALGRLHPGVAERLFEDWLSERKGLGLLARVGPRGHAELLRHAAVSGLAVLEAADVEARIQAVAARADSDLKRHCAATLARRRAEGRRRG
jgi:hypothetical protein